MTTAGKFHGGKVLYARIVTGEVTTQVAAGAPDITVCTGTANPGPSLMRKPIGLKNEANHGEPAKGFGDPHMQVLI